ncbi:mitochondrial carrier [Trichoderma citrinoviride]|uniref:Mitochondrial carrier n=1 Tax=Trichoderma citrinoviride TaxID=58853 RepID=A0A2T4BJZ5_9HYPO|nr:mitochondrial carrier [Trichoderma citrinoviride]PTB69634.1 mitochondrial carrier [Trichoderma citrinoviride]
MSYTKEHAVNPLRPYHRPPTIEERAEPVSIPSSNPFSGGNSYDVASGAKYASKAKNMLNDLDYKELMSDSPSVVGSARELVDELIWKYMSVLLGQPFEVAKMILQVRDQDEKAALTVAAEPETPAAAPQVPSRAGSAFEGEDSEGDEPAYFTTNDPAIPNPWNPNQPQAERRPSSRRASSPLQSPTTPKKAPAVPEHFLNLRRPDAVLDVIGQLWQRDGAWGVWKGANATFLYTVLQSLLENWSRSFLSAVFNVPDLGVRDNIDRLVDIASPYPWASLLVAAAAAVTTSLALAPLDLVRTRLILTNPFKGQRRTIASLRALPSYYCPSTIVVPTILHSLVNPIFTLSTPLALKTKFMLTSEVAPMTFSAAKFFASSVGILIKLPLETVLRRGQLAVLSEPEYLEALNDDEPALETIVPIGKYYGTFGTMYHIVTEEGAREIPPKPVLSKRGKVKTKNLQPTYKKGQGVEGLWRGWRIGWWGLVGLWMANMVGHGGDGEF